MTEAEWKTRKERIDKKLKALHPSWKIVRFKEGTNTVALDACAVEEFPTDNGPADYALFVKGKLLGIIEAKKVSVNPQNVLEQAKRYARGVRDGAGTWNGYKVPFLYSTNGELIHFLDVRSENSFSRTLSQFHTLALFHNVDRPLQRIREFCNRPEPKVVVSVDMLTTGVDIPALEFIVFLRMVKSRILWVQMLGRGTRRCDEINKTHFTIFDCFDGTLIEYFKNATDFDLETPDREVVPLKQVIENIYQNVDREYYTRVLVKRLHRIDRSMGAEARQQFAAYIPDGDMKKYASELTRKLEQDFANTMNLLRDEKFQDLLLNYQRAKRSFLIGYNVPDDVSSELVIKRGQDYLKPEDYLESFSRFVQQRADEIAAFQVLLKKPRDWRSNTLNGLREALIRNDYPEKDLQKAHQVVSHKSLADIISIVKHAAKEEEPVFTVEERVDRALKAVTADKTFTQEQKEWFGLIREHLIQNLTIELDDFQYAPIFERRGGLVRAQSVFSGKLKDKAGTDLTDHYTDILRKLREAKGLLGDIFAQSTARFNNPVNLKRLINMIDEEDWSSMDVDVKGACFEGLLEKAASEGKKGAGQYFTPRVLIQSIVRVMKPDPRGKSDFTICDPACGTGGFLVCSYEWLMGQTKGGALPREETKRIKAKTYYGQELVPRPRRLTLMNLFLHGVEPKIYLGDSIYEPRRPGLHDCVLTNPPFGTKGANQAPERDDFTIETSNKQLNFVQHVVNILKPGGRAAMVLPDNCLFEGKAGEVLKLLMKDCDLHTILRLPRGTFTPYSQGVKANVIFFQKGPMTVETWIYDARSNVPGITKKDRPMTSKHFEGFEKCYGKDPNGRNPRKDLGTEGRFRKFSLKEIEDRDYKLDVTWLKDESLEDADDLPEPQDLATEAITELEAVVDELREIVTLVEKEEGIP